MWARNIELMLGLWLVISPFVLRHPGEDRALWVSDLLCGALVVLFSLLSYVKVLRRSHLLTLGVGLWLFVYGRFLGAPGAEPLPPAQQNHVLIGLLLLMMAVVPSRATEPPKPWRRRAEAS